jgi:hypothetical protein
MPLALVSIGFIAINVIALTGLIQTAHEDGVIEAMQIRPSKQKHGYFT